MGDVEELVLKDGLVISDQRCLFDRSSGTLVIADLHLGLEGSAKEDGVYFPRVQKDDIVKNLETILNRYSPDKIIIDGDLKHTFDRNLYQEWQEIKEVFGLLQDRVDDVGLVRGNHDNYLVGILPKGTDLPLMRTEGRLQVVHGHKVEALGKYGRAEGKVLVLGHEHPSFLLKDKIGAAVRLPCFLYHPEEDIVILPAFSTLTKGSDVLSRGFLSKIVKDIEPGEFLAYGVSDIGLLELGRLGNLVPKTEDVPDFL